MKRLLPLCCLAGLALAVPGAAWAHATLTGTSPSFQQRLAQSPRFVQLRFDQSVKAFPNAIAVYTAKGRVVSGLVRPGKDPRVVTVPVRRLARRAYTVRWRVVSADSHVASGVFTFGVGVRAPPPTAAFGASGPTTREHIVRWLYFVALALVGGGLGFRLLILRGPLPAKVERRFYHVVGAGAIGAIEIGILAFLLRAEDALQLPFGTFLYGDLSPIAVLRFGRAFVVMTLGFALVCALLFLAWLTEKRILLWPAFVLSIGLASGLSLSGHSAVDSGSSGLSELADWAHLAAASLWVGGLVQLAFVVWPLAPELRRAAFLRFSRLATVLIAVLLGAGTYLSILRLPHLHDLWTVSYGQVLLVKLGLVSLALLWGAVHHFVVRPALERGAPPFGPSALSAKRFDRSVQTDGRAKPVRPEGGIASAALAGLPRSLIGESAVGVAILLVAAILVESKPPPQPLHTPRAQRASSAIPSRVDRSFQTGGRAKLARPDAGIASDASDAPTSQR